MKLGFEGWVQALAGACAAVAIVAAVMAWASGSTAAGLGWLLFLSALLATASVLAVRRSLVESARESEEILKQAAALEDAMERHRNAIDALAGGLKSAIFVCDSRAQILHANDRARELFRFDDSSGRSILAVTIDYELEQIVLEAARNSEPIERELQLGFPEERTAIARAWLEPGGARVFVSLYDITELRRLERVRQDFVANVSHELRTPLSAIRSLAETLYDEPKAQAAKRTDYLQRIIGEVDRLAVIVSDLLVLSSAESGPVRRQSCNFSAVVESSLELLKPKAKAKGLALEERLESEVLISANPDQLNQVVINLIDNAINYTPEGKIDVSLTKDAAEAVLTIADTGIGIASEELPRIFERFYRVDKGRSRASGGTGLGLSIVRHIVEAHGGKVEVQSALNEGTTFTIRLPALSG